MMPIATDYGIAQPFTDYYSTQFFPYSPASLVHESPYGGFIVQPNLMKDEDLTVRDF